MALEKIKTISAAESCTGGLISHLITNKPGSSDYFKGSIISYSNESKVFVLKVPVSFIKKYGAVSDEVARKMSAGVRKIMKTDIGLAVTGIAGPGGGSAKKPVGLVYMSVTDKKGTKSFMFLFKGKRPDIKKQAAMKALKLLKL